MGANLRRGCLIPILLTERRLGETPEVWFSSKDK